MNSSRFTGEICGEIRQLTFRVWIFRTAGRQVAKEIMISADNRRDCPRDSRDNAFRLDEHA